jgi:hypothetical protein
MPEARIPIDDLLPVACPEAPAAPVIATAPSPRVEPDESDTFAFVMDGSAELPALELSGLDAAGVATHLRFTATSTAPTGGFGPVASGFTVEIAGLYYQQNVLHAVLDGAGWSRRDDGTWVHRDPSGLEVEARPLDGGRLAWRIEGPHGAYPTQGAGATRWPTLGVHVAAADGRHADVFFPTVGNIARCADDTLGVISCRVPSKAPDCDMADTDADALMRCAAERVAYGQARFFATHGRYSSGRCNDVAGTTLPGTVLCLLVGSPHSFQVSTIHPGATHRHGCTWRSDATPGTPPIVCS